MARPWLYSASLLGLFVRTRFGGEDLSLFRRTVAIASASLLVAVNGCAANPWSLPKTGFTAAQPAQFPLATASPGTVHPLDCTQQPQSSSRRGEAVRLINADCSPCDDGPTVCVPEDSSCPEDATCYVDSSDLPGSPVDDAGGGEGGGGGGGSGGGGGTLTYAQRILAATLADWGMKTRNLYGAPYRNECVAAVQQVLADAGLAQILTSNGTVILYVPTFVSQLQYSDYDETTSPVAGDIVDLSDEHVGICTNAGCTSMISNGSTAGTFSWDQSTATQNAAVGGGSITYYHHLP